MKLFFYCCYEYEYAGKMKIKYININIFNKKRMNQILYDSKASYTIQIQCDQPTMHELENARFDYTLKLT